MMSNIKNIPKRRFSNFEDEWEEKKLEELSNIVRGASPRPIQDPKWFDEKSEIGWLRISDVSEQDGRIYKLEQRLSELGQQKTRVVHEPHLLMSIAATVGKPVINYIKTGVHDGFLIFLEPKFNLEFMFKWLEMYKNQWKRYGQPGSQLNLNSDIVKNQTIILPEYNEQVAIGSFFQLLDQSITLHQHKLDKLKNLKKSYLAELFPAEGKRVPKRRFPGFEGEWRQKKLGEVVVFKRGLTYNPSSISKTGIRVLRSSNIEEDYFIMRKDDVFVDESDISIPFVEKGDILITSANGSSRLVGKHAIIDSDEKMVHGGFMLLAKTKQFNFINALFSSDWYRHFINRTVLGGNGAIGNLNKSYLEQEEPYFPTDEEQEKIGEFFHILDKSIALQQQKLDKLKDLKKAYLNELFV